jgi:glycosyltransferase involved in cell wall biosynthesis
LNFGDSNLFRISDFEFQISGLSGLGDLEMYERVLIVIPAFNEEKTISRVLKDLREVVPNCHRLVVNDGSKDNTGNLVAELGEKQIKLPCNIGYGRALQTGLKYALTQGYDIVICFDADGQHQAENVPLMLEALKESGADVVIGSRYCNGVPYTGPFGRRIGQYIFSQLTRLLIRRRIYDTSSGFKAMSSAACEVIIGGTFLDFHIEALVRLSMFGFKIEELPITMQERNFGKSMHSYTSFVEYPLKTLLLTFVAAVDALIERRAR